jgi:hypothetical protein
MIPPISLIDCDPERPPVLDVIFLSKLHKRDDILASGDRLSQTKLDQLTVFVESIHVLGVRRNTHDVWCGMRSCVAEAGAGRA